MYVCICRAVTDLQVERAIAEGATTEAEVGAMTGAGTGCGGCLGRICDRLARVDAQHMVSYAVRLSA